MKKGRRAKPRLGFYQFLLSKVFTFHSHSYLLASIGVPGENFPSKIFPIPGAPHNLFPYLFLVYLALGAGWFAFMCMRSPRIIEQMEADIEASHNQFSEMKKV
jgi:hypothetical protein